MADFPKGITRESFNEGFKKAFSIQNNWRSLLDDAYQFFIPQQNVFRDENTTAGNKRDARIMDGTPEDAMNEGANKVKAAITPDWRQWAQLKAGFELPKEIRESQEVKEQLKDITEILFSHINASNFSIQMGEAYKDWLIGTGAIEIRENTNPTESMLSYHAINQQLIAYEVGPFGNIENEYKSRTIPARNVERTYPDGDFSNELRTKIKDSPSTEVTFKEGYIKTDEGYFLIVTENGTDQLVWAMPQGLSNPIAVFRYAVMADEVRGRGPALSALPDARTLNKIQEFALQKAALELAGMYTSVDDGTFNANTMTIAPGVIIPVGTNATNNPSLQRLDTGTDLNLSLFEIDRMTASIRKTLFNDLRDPSDTVVSATQFMIETQALAARIGGAFGRINSEGLVPILNRSIEILQRRGVIPNLIIDGRQITVKFTSPLAKAQDTEDIMSLQQTVELSNMMAGPELTALGFNLDLIPSYIADKTGMDVSLVKSEGERAEAQQQMAEAAAMAMEQQQEEPQQQLA